MSRLPLDEVRRLVSHLRMRVSDPDRLIELEGELADEEAEFLLLEPDFLAYFPGLTENVVAAGVQWQLRIIPHAHLRMIQRGIAMDTVLSMFSRFVEKRFAEWQTIAAGAYAIYERSSNILVRVDIDIVETGGGKGHVVTVFFGRSASAETVELD